MSKMMICEHAKTCKVSHCEHRKGHEYRSLCSELVDEECTKCIPYRPRKRPAKRTRKVVKRGWVSNRFLSYLKTLNVATFHTIKRPFCIYRATLTIEVPAK
jgi:hypothetical protein